MPILPLGEPPSQIGQQTDYESGASPFLGKDTGRSRLPHGTSGRSAFSSQGSLDPRRIGRASQGEPSYPTPGVYQDMLDMLKQVDLSSLETSLEKSPVTEVNPFKTLDNAIRYILTEREPIDYSKTVTPETRVLAIGENHRVAEHRQELARILPQLRQLGFTHLAMEFWGRDMQPALDEFQSAGTGKEKLEEYAQRLIGKLGEDFIGVIETAQQAGIKIIGIDITQEERKNYDINKREDDDKRERAMADVVRKALEENEQHKVITYTGGLHAEKSTSTMAGLLIADRHPVSSVNLVSAKDNGLTNLERALGQTNLNNTRFMLPALNKYPNSSAKYDWMINIPKNNSTRENNMYFPQTPFR